MTARPSVLQRMRPEVGVAGFSHRDSTIEFYTTVNALLHPGATVLDIGAGRGAFLDDESAYRRDLRLFKGRVAEVIGVDTDPAVASNAALDRHYVTPVGDPLPLPDESVDIVVSDWTFEHVTNPEAFAKELKRVLKPGGWICARTPNKWGLTGVGARLVPNRIHALLLRWLSPRRQEKDVFPVAYKLNTQRAIRGWFPPPDFHDFSYFENGDPSYYGGSEVVWRATEMFFRLTPRRFAAKYFIFLQKKAAGASSTDAAPQFGRAST
jgi:SAM-dependent methyltransferase